MKKSVTIPHLTGGNNNKVVQVIEWMQALGNPVFTDSKGNHLPHQQIVELYDEAISPSDNKPIVKVFYETNETEYVRNNPAKPGKRKTAARDKYMANLLGGKDGNDLLNLASKVGSRKAAVEILKSGSTKTPFNVEMPLSDEDEIGSLKMQGLTPSVDALVDEGFRAKLHSDIRGLLGEENVDEKLAELDKGVLITDEGIEDFRQMLTVYHLSHQMNGPLANSIKGHVPRKHADLFDRLIPTFDDILAGENLVLFANSIKKHPESRNTNFPLMEESDTLIPSWLQLALPSDDALRELKENLGEREVESALQTLASGDFMGSFYKVLSSVRETLAWPLVTLLRGLGGTSRQDDRQARLFDDLNENITDALVSDYGRGRGYTNRKELAKAVMFSASEAYDRRLTELFSPLKITINAARRVRSFSKSGVKLELTVDLNTFDAGDVKGTPARAIINPGMFYIGNFDFRIPPIGWNRKWMNGTAQIIHEYWNYIRPSGNVAANAAFMPVSDDRSLSLPQILYLIAIRTKEIYNYDLSPEEWVTLIKVLGGKNALTENYYSSSNSDLLSGIDNLILSQERQIIDNRETMRALTAENALHRARRNPSENSSALPQVYYDNLFDMATLMKNRQKALASQQKETQKFFNKLKEFNKNKKDKIADLNKKKKTIDGVMKSWKKEEEKARGWHEKAMELEAQIKPLKVFQDSMEALKVLGGEAEPISNIWSRKQLEFILQNSEILHQKGQPAFIQEMNLEEEWRAAGKMSKQQTHDWLVKTLLGEETDSKAADVLLELVEEVEEEKLASEIITIENNLEEILDDSGNDFSEVLAELFTPEAESMKEVGDLAEGLLAPEMIDLPPKKIKDAAGPKGVGKKLKSSWLLKYPKQVKGKNPHVVKLKPNGKIGVVFDTHADWQANMEIISHMEDKHGSLNHVVWAGDCFDGGRGYTTPQLEYTAGEDDLKNWEYIKGLMKSDPNKYIFLAGNHERIDLAPGMNPQTFWQWAKKEGVYEQYSQETQNLPLIAKIRNIMICHGGFPHIVLFDTPHNLRRFWDDSGVWTRDVQLHTLWNRPSNGSTEWDSRQERLIPGDTTSGFKQVKLDKEGMRKQVSDFDRQYALNTDFEKGLARFGINTMITAHTPAINYGAIGKAAYKTPTFLHISGQSSRDITLKPIYAVIDFDAKNITIEVGKGIHSRLDESEPALEWVETHTEDLPTQFWGKDDGDPDGPTIARPYRFNPGHCSCGCAEGKCMCPPDCDCGCNHAKGGASWAKTNPTIPMYVGTPTGRVKNLGSITAIVQVGRNIIKDVGEGIQDIYRSLIGGRQSMTEKRMAMAVAEMQADLERECLELGGNVVGNIQIDYEYPATGSDITLIAVADAFKTPKKNPASNYHKYEKKVISILKKEGGAAGLKALRPAFPKGTAKAKVVGMLQKMNHVVLHADGDYILMQGISNPPFNMREPYKGTSTPERLLLWASMHIDPYYEGEDTGMDDSHSAVSYPTDIQEYKAMHGTKKKLFSIEKIKHSKGTNVRYFSANDISSEGGSIIGSFLRLKLWHPDFYWHEETLSKEYKAKVDIGYFEKNDSSRAVLIVRIEQILPNPPKSARKNQPEELLCIYKKSSRSKPCGSPLRVKKNPKGRYACRKCGAEYEMR